jgi:hypothetical protein
MKPGADGFLLRVIKRGAEVGARGKTTGSGEGEGGKEVRK